ncbi:MAG TPA: hypothetical protein VF043_31870 [Ktedonobacteraceae bacterium]
MLQSPTLAHFLGLRLSLLFGATFRQSTQQLEDMNWWSMRQAKATRCKPATVAADDLRARSGRSDGHPGGIRFITARRWERRIETRFAALRPLRGFAAIGTYAVLSREDQCAVAQS